MNDKDNGGAAFPMRPERRQKFSQELEMVTPGEWSGMSLRDYFAASALHGILACSRDHIGAESIDGRVAKAYQYSDAMLKERAK